MLLVYDVTDEKSFNNIRPWYSAVQQHASDNVVLILVGNKSDMVDKRVVSTEQGQALANELGIPFIESSAKTKDNVDKTFFDLVSRVKETMFNDTSKRPSFGGSVNVGASTSTSN